MFVICVLFPSVFLSVLACLHMKSVVFLIQFISIKKVVALKLTMPPILQHLDLVIFCVSFFVAFCVVVFCFLFPILCFCLFIFLHGYCLEPLYIYRMSVNYKLFFVMFVILCCFSCCLSFCASLPAYETSCLSNSIHFNQKSCCMEVNHAPYFSKF